MAASASEYLQAHNNVIQIITALENVMDPAEIDGIVLRVDYLLRTLVNLTNIDNHLETDQIIRPLGQSWNKLTEVTRKFGLLTELIM